MRPAAAFLLFFSLFFSSLASERLLLAVLSSGSPVQEYKKFKNLSAYLEEKLNKKVELKIFGNYENLLRYYDEHFVDVSIVCPVVYYKILEKHKVDAAAVVKIKGDIMEAGVIVARKNGDISSIKDLKGKKITLGSSICASNCIMPLYVLSKNGIKYTDISDMWSSGSDRAAILAVISGLADAAGVKEESAYKFLGRGIKIIAKSPSVPRYIVVINKALPEKEQKQIKNALFSLKNKNLLKKIGIDGFERPSPEMFSIVKDYNDILSQYPLLK